MEPLQGVDGRVRQRRLRQAVAHRVIGVGDGDRLGGGGRARLVRARVVQRTAVGVPVHRPGVAALVGGLTRRPPTPRCGRVALVNRRAAGQERLRQGRAAIVRLGFCPFVFEASQARHGTRR